MGYELLLDKNKLCCMMEDLTPQLGDEIDFFSKLYSDDVGRIIYSAVTNNNGRRNSCFEEIGFF